MSCPDIVILSNLCTMYHFLIHCYIIIVGSRVQCVATASSNSVYEGLERESPVVTVSKTEGVCKPQRAGFSGGEPYLTKIKYLGKIVYYLSWCRIPQITNLSMIGIH